MSSACTPSPRFMPSSSLSVSDRTEWKVIVHAMLLWSSIGTQAWPLSALPLYGGISVYHGKIHWVIRQ